MRDTKRNLLMSGLVVIALAWLAATPLSAQNNGRGVLTLCAAWNLNVSGDCEVSGDDSPLGMALTTAGSPSFSIWVNGGSSNIVSNVSLVVFVPDTSATPTFSVTFAQNGSSLTLASGDVTSGLFGDGQRVLQDVFGLTTFNHGTDYFFGNIQGVQGVDGVTSYTAFLFESGFNLDTSDPNTLIDVDFGGGALPPGAIILAIGFGSPEVTYMTPLTNGMQVVPEPNSFLLLGTGLLGLGLFELRRRRRGALQGL